MLHQLSLARLPVVEAVERMRPPGSARARPSGAFMHRGALVYRGERGLHAGPEGRCLHPDPEGWCYLGAESAGSLIIAKKAKRRMVPPIAQEVVFLREGQGEVATFPGQCFAQSRSAKRAVVADLRSGELSAIDLRTFSARSLGKIEGALEPRYELPLWLSDDGAVLLYLETDAEQRGSRLIRLDLETGRKRLARGPIAGPSWISGIRLPGAPSGRILSLTMHLAPRPRFELYLEDSLLLELDQPQSRHPPTIVGSSHVAMVLSPERPPFVSYGPSDLYLVPLRAGVLHRLTQSGDVRGKTRLEDGAIWVEGGTEVVKVSLSRST